MITKILTIEVTKEMSWPLNSSGVGTIKFYTIKKSFRGWWSGSSDKAHA
jgi:hypothetical protein